MSGKFFVYLLVKKRLMLVISLTVLLIFKAI